MRAHSHMAKPPTWNCTLQNMKRSNMNYLVCVLQQFSIHTSCHLSYFSYQGLTKQKRILGQSIVILSEAMKAKMFQKGGLTWQSRIIESVRSVQDNEYKNISKDYVLLVLVLIAALELIVALLGHVLSDGILPNVHKGLSLITYHAERQFSSQASESMVRLPSFDFGTLEGKVLGPTKLPAIGASVTAQEELGS